MPDHPLTGRRRIIDIAACVTPEICAACDARHIGLCDVLPDEDVHFLAGVARQQRIAAGKVFIEEGEAARHFFNINQGAVKLFKALPDGRRQITGFMGPGGFLGLVTKETYSVAAEALEEVRLCRFDRAELSAMFGHFPALERRLLDAAWHELALAQEQMLLLGRKTAVERVASFCSPGATGCSLARLRRSLSRCRWGASISPIISALRSKPCRGRSPCCGGKARSRPRHKP